MQKIAFTMITLMSLAVAQITPVNSVATVSYVVSSEQHVAKLNSPTPYVAGFHVNSDNLTLREVVNATAVTVSFGETNPQFFPNDSWIGGGMFLQGQDTFYINVDYGFYMMLTADSSSRLFIDLGLHQTEEATGPNHTPRWNTVYSYSWQILGANLSDKFTLEQRWIDRNQVQYSVLNSNNTAKLATINVRNMPNCQNIIPKFYAGNVIIDPFPLSRYINYFQFGVISNRAITDPYWQITIQQPKMLRQAGWTTVKKAWLIQGSRSYLDHDLKWGGTDYDGVNPTYAPSAENPYTITFQYSGKTAAETVLWDTPDNGPTPAYASPSNELTRQSRCLMPLLLPLFGAIIVACLFIVGRKRVNR